MLRDPRYELHALMDMKDPPDPVLDPSRIPRFRKYTEPKQKIVRIPGYGNPVDGDFLEFVIRNMEDRLRRVPKAAELFEALDCYRLQDETEPAVTEVEDSGCVPAIVPRTELHTEINRFRTDVAPCVPAEDAGCEMPEDWYDNFITLENS